VTCTAATSTPPRSTTTVSPANDESGSVQSAVVTQSHQLRMIHDRMPYDPIQGQGQGHGSHLRKWPISSANMQAIKTITVNYDNQDNI